MDKIRNHKKMLGAGLAVLLALLAGVTLLSRGGTDVEFTVLAEEKYPGDIASQVIPEYRKLERALACLYSGENTPPAGSGDDACLGALTEILDGAGPAAGGKAASLGIAAFLAAASLMEDGEENQPEQP